MDAINTAIGSALTIGLALAGFGVWSIALRGALVAAASLPLLARGSGGCHGSLSKPACREVVSFRSFVTGSEAAVFVTKNVDYLLIGGLLGASGLGVYTLAFLLTDTFRSAMMGVLNKVM